jgi:hypothetical protein
VVPFKSNISGALIHNAKEQIILKKSSWTQVLEDPELEGKK